MDPKCTIIEQLTAKAAWTIETASLSIVPRLEFGGPGCHSCCRHRSSNPKTEAGKVSWILTDDKMLCNHEGSMACDSGCPSQNKK